MLVFVCLFDDLIVGFCYSNLTQKTDELELASTITLVLQANRLIKCASHPKNLQVNPKTIGAVNKDIKHKPKFCRQSLQNIFYLKLAPGNFTPDLFNNFGNSNAFNTLLT